MKKFCFAFLVVAYSSPVMASDVCDEPLKIGYEEFFPFEGKENSEMVGINIDIQEKISRKIGCNIVWVESPWKRLLRSVENGEIDIANTASINPKREKYANFSIPYLPYEAILFVGEGSKNTANSLKSYLDEGHSLAIVREYDYGEETMSLIEKKEYKEQINVTNAPELSVRIVAAGRVDATIGNRYTLSHTAQENGVRDKITATNTVVQSSPIHFMFSKKSVPQKVIDAYNEAIVDLKAEGAIQVIVDKYTGQTGG